MSGEVHGNIDSHVLRPEFTDVKSDHGPELNGVK